jgi:hypothetical protein
VSTIFRDEEMHPSRSPIPRLMPPSPLRRSRSRSPIRNNKYTPMRNASHVTPPRFRPHGIPFTPVGTAVKHWSHGGTRTQHAYKKKSKIDTRKRKQKRYTHKRSKRQ